MTHIFIMLAALAQDDDVKLKQMTARAHLAQIGAACKLYKQLNGEEPKTLRHLVERAGAKSWPDGGFLLGGAVPRDPWGRDYQYELGGKIPRVWSRGADGKEGGAGADADIGYADNLEADVEANERAAAVALKEITTAQADFRSNDRDGNLVCDFWAGDVHALYALAPITAGETAPVEAPGAALAIKLIGPDLARADASPRRIRGLAHAPPEKPAPYHGYLFRAIDRDENDLEYAQDTDGAEFYGPVHNRSMYGVCAYPAEYGKTGRMTLFVTADHTVWKKDTKGARVERAPENPAKEGWERAR